MCWCGNETYSRAFARTAPSDLALAVGFEQDIHVEVQADQAQDVDVEVEIHDDQVAVGADNLLASAGGATRDGIRDGNGGGGQSEDGSHGELHIARWGL